MRALHQEAGKLLDGGQPLRRPEVPAGLAEHGLRLGDGQAIALENRGGEKLVVGRRPPMDVAALQQDAVADALAEKPLLFIGRVEGVVIETIIEVVMRHDPAIAQTEAKNFADLCLVGFLLFAGRIMHRPQDIEARLRPAVILHQECCLIGHMGSAGPLAIAALDYSQ